MVTSTGTVKSWKAIAAEGSPRVLREVLNNLQTAMNDLVAINTALDESLIVAITDHRGTITFANRKFCELSKYSKEELLGQNHRIINSGYHSKEFFRQMWRTIANGKIWRGEIRNRAKDGTYYWVDTTIVPCLDERGKPYQYVSFRIDITERKRTEEQLRRMDKMEAVAQLASSIAHEIRNPLAAIKMTVQSLKMDTSEQQELMSMVISELDRIDAIVNQFMYLSKSQETHFQNTDIRPILAMAVKLMSIPARKTGVRIELACPEPVGLVRCDSHQLQQVFINILKNAIEAMPNGGVVKVELARGEADQVLIRVADEGCGIPPEQLSRIGEPFHTTKEYGTGLGLTVSRKIIEEHGGTIQIRSQPGKGTLVEIRLPLGESA
jgi:PAS domain S-box-containing protein